MRLRLVVMVLQMRRRRVWRRCDAAQRAAKAATQIGHSTRRRTGSDQVCRRCWRRRRRRLGWSGRLMVVVVVVVRGRWRRLAARSRQFAGTEFEFALRLRWLARLKFQRRSQRRRAGRRLFAFAPGEALQSRAHRPQIGRAAVQSERRRPTTSGRLRFQRQRLLLQRCRRSVAQNRRRIRRRRHHRSTGDRFDHSLALIEDSTDGRQSRRLSHSVAFHRAKQRRRYSCSVLLCPSGLGCSFEGRFRRNRFALLRLLVSPRPIKLNGKPVD